jgi:hypothetical protein
MALEKRTFITTIVSEAYVEPGETGRAEVEKRIADAIGTHPTLSLRVEGVSTVEKGQEGTPLVGAIKADSVTVVEGDIGTLTL